MKQQKINFEVSGSLSPVAIERLQKSLDQFLARERDIAPRSLDGTSFQLHVNVPPTLANGRRRELIDADTGLVTWANFRDFLIKDIELDFIDAQTDIFRGIWKSLTEHAGANINQNFHISHCGCALRSKSIGGSDYRSIAIEPDGLIAVFINKDIFRIKVNPKGARLNSGALVGDNATPKQKSMTLGAVSFYRESITKFCEALKLEIENPVTTIDLI